MSISDTFVVSSILFFPLPHPLLRLRRGLLLSLFILYPSLSLAACDSLMQSAAFHMVRTRRKWNHLSLSDSILRTTHSRISELDGKSTCGSDARSASDTRYQWLVKYNVSLSPSLAHLRLLSSPSFSSFSSLSSSSSFCSSCSLRAYTCMWNKWSINSMINGKMTLWEKKCPLLPPVVGHHLTYWSLITLSPVLLQ